MARLPRLPKWPRGLRARVNAKKRRIEREAEIASRKKEIQEARNYLRTGRKRAKK